MVSSAISPETTDKLTAVTANRANLLLNTCCQPCWAESEGDDVTVTVAGEGEAYCPDTTVKQATESRAKERLFMASGARRRTDLRQKFFASEGFAESDLGL